MKHLLLKCALFIVLCQSKFKSNIIAAFRKLAVHFRMEDAIFSTLQYFAGKSTKILRI